MVSRKRVTDLTVEGVVIVVSILLAFALEAWWDAHGRRQEEAQILENLRVEFLAAGTQLDYYLLFHEVTLVSLETILDALREAGGTGSFEVEVPTLDLGRTLIGPTFDPRTGTLDGLLHSGKGGILRSDELQKTLSGWPGLLAEAKEEETRIDRLLMDQLEPTLRKNSDSFEAHLLLVEVQEEGCSNVLVGRDCEDMEKEADSPPEWAGTSTLPVNSEILGLFASRFQILSHAVDQFGEVRAEIDTILVQVEESLGG